MKNLRWIRDSSGGYTLIELSVAVMILGILVSIAIVSLETVKARVRYSKMRADIDAIARAAEIDFTNHEGDWAQAEIPGDPPTFAATDLSRWPKAPCNNWVYSWDNMSGFGPPYEAVRVTIRDQDGNALFGFCLETFGTPCVDVPDPYSIAAVADLTQVTNPYIYCNELSGL
jgi:prepilin-type N-terminal cleavage/methylation domain-containing protein